LCNYAIREIPPKKGDGPQCRTRNPGGGDPDPTPPTTPKPTHLPLPDPNPLHPLDLHPTPPPGFRVLQCGAPEKKVPLLLLKQTPED